jgi:hypothetical protein
VLAIVIPAFGQSFSPGHLCGWRAKQFTEREDCFQQLIGDAVREVHGADAHVSPTLGRDGSIDAWVEQPDASCNLLGGLDGPVIIECKDHQEQSTWPATWRNILAGWDKVRAKLQTQAEGGFTGKFEPWLRARSYAYCVSAGIPDQQSKDDLKSRIEDILQPIAPHIQNVVVCDWGTLSFWLNKHRRVADMWLGVGHPAILDHSHYINSLTGFRKYLLGENLAYEAPNADADTHPDTVWRLLASEDADRQPGLVLYGPSGVGKTRLCLEVAARAYGEGWRVLHISPSEESLSERELISVIAADTRPTLLCLDYIDFMQSADYLTGGKGLIREAASRGTRLRFLGNSRPMWARPEARKAEALETFSFRELRPTEEENERLLRSITSSVAPNALAKWGHQELRRVCGRRPIIALLIAREIEDRLGKGLLDHDALEPMAGGDLSAWLRRRLAQDQLTIKQPESVWQQGAPSNEMAAACGALVTAPNNSPIIADAAAAVLRSLGSRSDAGFVVGRLAEMGWLEWHGPWLTTPHDAVADEVLDQVVRDGDLIRTGSLEAVFSLWSCEAPAIGRIATAFQRWTGGLPEGHPAIAMVNAASANWLRSHAGAVGNLLAAGDPDRTGFALGAILRCPAWSAVATDCWHELLSPWIAVNGRLREARHFYYVGLHDDSLATRLLAPALAWLVEFRLEKEAGFVLPPLLGRAELQGEQLKEAISFALVWVAKFPLEIDARFVLAALLGRAELQGQQLEAVTGYALVWLAKYPLEKEARFVLKSLLGRVELQDKQLEMVIGRALAWLAKYPLEKEAGFVLAPLLGRVELQEKQLEAAIGYALGWLAHYPAEKEAGFVLASLLERRELKGTELDSAVDRALDWLPSYLDTEAAEFVLKRLLPHSPLPEDKIGTLKKAAIDMLRPRVRDEKDEGVSYLLRPWLHCRVPHPDLDREIISLGCEWLRADPTREGADYVFNRILRRRDASDADWLFAAQVACDWLRASKRGFKDEDYAVNSLLTRPDVLPYSLLSSTIRVGLGLLPAMPNQESRKYLHSHLLRSIVHLPASDKLVRGVHAFFQRYKI